MRDAVEIFMKLISSSQKVCYAKCDLLELFCQAQTQTQGYGLGLTLFSAPEGAFYIKIGPRHPNGIKPVLGSGLDRIDCKSS